MTRPLSSQAVLILGAAPRIAVPIARVLQEECATPVHVAALSASESALQSRAVRSFTHLPDFRSAPSLFSDALLSLMQQKEIDTIIPIQDRALAAISANYTKLSALARVACPPPHIVERVLNKNLTLSIAEQCGIPVPRGIPVSSAGEALAMADSLQFPVILKPAETKYAGVIKARFFGDSSELLAWFDSQGQNGRYLLQEYCRGEGVGIEMLMHDGRCIAKFQHRRLKEHPPDGGVAVIAVSELPDPQLTDAAERLLRAMEWEGVAMVEFRNNLADGSVALMEVNGRYWGTTALPLMAGIRFPVYQWQILHGQMPAIPHTYKPGVRWRWTAGYLARTHRVLFTAHSGPLRSSRRQELMQLPSDLGLSVRDPLWSLSDPFAGLQEGLGAIWELVRNDANALFKISSRLVGRALRGFRRAIGIFRQVCQSRFAKPRPAGFRQNARKARSFVFVSDSDEMRGVICASLFQRELSGRGIDGVSVASAGTHVCTGEPAHAGALEIAHQFGIFLDEHRPQPLTPQLVAEADAIIAVDSENQRKILAAYPLVRQKTFTLARCPDLPCPSGDISGELELTQTSLALFSACIKNLAGTLFSDHELMQNSRTGDAQQAAAKKG